MGIFMRHSVYNLDTYLHMNIHDTIVLFFNDNIISYAAAAMATTRTIKKCARAWMCYSA